MIVIGMSQRIVGINHTAKTLLQIIHEMRVGLGSHSTKQITLCVTIFLIRSLSKAVSNSRKWRNCRRCKDNQDKIEKIKFLKKTLASFVIVLELLLDFSKKKSLREHHLQ